MKKALFSLALAAIIFSGCSKSSSSNNNSAGNSWTLGSTTYTAAAVVYQVQSGQAGLSGTTTPTATGNSDGLGFAFATAPTATGTATISPLGAAGSVVIVAAHLTNGTPGATYASGTSSTKLNVTVTNGKVSVSLPTSVWLYNTSTPTTDSLKLSVSNFAQTN